MRAAPGEQDVEPVSAGTADAGNSDLECRFRGSPGVHKVIALSHDAVVRAWQHASDLRHARARRLACLTGDPVDDIPIFLVRLARWPATDEHLFIRWASKSCRGS